MQARPTLALSILLAASLGRAQTVISPPASWLSNPYGGVREGIDTNLFGVSTNLAGHPAVADVSSWFTTVSAGLAADLLQAAAAPKDGFFKTLTLAYAADYTAYEAVAREDNLRNTFTLEARGQEGPWTLSIDNPLLYVDGSKQDVAYFEYNNLGYAPTRERRNQIQERNTSFIRYDAPTWFGRAVATATYFNLLIDEHDPIGAYKGYANWVNRDDVNAGLDFGYKLTSDFAFVAGWRVGQQTQARLNYSLVDNDNTYNRALFGFEGKPAKWLQLQVAGGPDFRRYGDGSNSGIAGNRHTWLYLQDQLTATLAPADSLSFTNKVWHWVSSAGVSSIQETLDTFSYRHVFSSQLSASAGYALDGHRYDYPALRNDWTRAFPVDVTYFFTRSLSLSADYTDTGGKTHLSPIVSPGQNFSDNVVSLALKALF